MKTKVASLALLLTLIFPIMAKSQVKIQQTAGRDALGEFAPEFARLNDDILFGEVWSRNNLLSLRDRSIVTVVALMSQGLTDSSFKYHLESAKKNGVTRTEIAEILTHAAFYAGWPKAWAAFRMAKEVWTGGNADSVAAGSLEAYAQTIISRGETQRCLCQVFHRSKLHGSRGNGRSPRGKCDFRAGLPQQLACAQGNERRRSDTRMRGRSRLLSGVGQRAGGTTFRGCYQYSRRRETLARGGSRQLVLAFSHRSAR